METKSKVRYELQWKNGHGADPKFQKVGHVYHTMNSVIRSIKGSCNHSVGSAFKVYEIRDGAKKEIDYNAYLN